MSIVSTLVLLSQTVRRITIRIQNSMIVRIEKRLDAITKQQVELEEHRSELMIGCHNRYYADRDALNARQEEELKAMYLRHEQEMKNLKATFEENKATIALTHQAASDELKRERVMLDSELDYLTR